MIDWRKNIQMNNYSISITDLAESDLEDIGDYIAYELKNSLAEYNQRYS